MPIVTQEKYTHTTVLLLDFSAIFVAAYLIAQYAKFTNFSSSRDHFRWYGKLTSKNAR